MTIYEISIITSTGFPYYHLKIMDLPKGIKLFLRFYDFTSRKSMELPEQAQFELSAGLISALYEFAKNLDKKIDLLEFTSKKAAGDLGSPINKTEYEGDVLITVQTETYLMDKAIEKKIKLIYDILVSSKIPLDSAVRINQSEERKIIGILTDAIAHKHLSNYQTDISILANDFLKEMGEYGLECIVITSFDLSPKQVFGNKYTSKDVEVILRNVGDLPEIDALEWKYRQSFFEGNQVQTYFINSGIGVTVENQLFEPYYYILIATPEGYLADFPGRLTREFNIVLS